MIYKSDWDKVFIFSIHAQDLDRDFLNPDRDLHVRKFKILEIQNALQNVY